MGDMAASFKNKGYFLSPGPIFGALPLLRQVETMSMLSSVQPKCPVGTTTLQIWPGLVPSDTGLGRAAAQSEEWEMGLPCCASRNPVPWLPLHEGIECMATL